MSFEKRNACFAYSYLLGLQTTYISGVNLTFILETSFLLFLVKKCLDNFKSLHNIYARYSNYFRLI